jgi:hypothetical protein
MSTQSSGRTLPPSALPHLRQVHKFRLAEWRADTDAWAQVADFLVLQLVLTARRCCTLRCTASPHGPPHVVLFNFWIPVGLVLTSRVIYSPQFALIPVVHVPPRFRLTFSITQHVLILFQPGARAVNTYLNICFKYSLFQYFLYITSALLTSFTLSTDRPSRVIKRDEPKGSFPLAYFISVSLIVHQSRP